MVATDAVHDSVARGGARVVLPRRLRRNEPVTRWRDTHPKLHRCRPRKRPLVAGVCGTAILGDAECGAVLESLRLARRWAPCRRVARVRAGVRRLDRVAPAAAVSPLLCRPGDRGCRSLLSWCGSALLSVAVAYGRRRLSRHGVHAHPGAAGVYRVHVRREPAYLHRARRRCHRSRRRVPAAGRVAVRRRRCTDTRRDRGSLGGVRADVRRLHSDHVRRHHRHSRVGSVQIPTTRSVPHCP